MPLPSAIFEVPEAAVFDQWFDLQFTQATDFGAIVNQGTNCVWFTSEKPFIVAGGNATAWWNSTSTTVRLSLTVGTRHAGGTVSRTEASQPSPLYVEFADQGTLAEGDAMWMSLAADRTSVANELPVRFHVAFRYEGDAVPDAEVGDCSLLATL